MLHYLGERLHSLYHNKESITLQIIGCKTETDYIPSINLVGKISSLLVNNKEIVVEVNDNDILLVIDIKNNTYSLNIVESKHKLSTISLTYCGGLVLERYDVTPEEDPAYA